MKYQNFAGKLHQLAKMMTALSEHRWATDGHADIKMAHIQALVNLNEANATNNQLAVKAGITKQSMNRITTELLKAGYIKHAEEQLADNRTRLFSLTTKGYDFMVYLNTTRYDLESKLTTVLQVHKFVELNNIIDTLLPFLELRHKNI